jgi:hypothetical protein
MPSPRLKFPFSPSLLLQTKIIATPIHIKQLVGQASKIAPDLLADHYSQNWKARPADIIIDDNSDFIIQRKLMLTENDMLKDLLDKNKMKDAINKSVICQHQDWIS